MLTELLEHEGTWNRVMPGARACVFAREPAEVPLVLPPLHFEALFCRAGSLILTRRDGTRLAAGSREVLLLTDIAGVTAAKMESALSGVLVAVEARAGPGEPEDAVRPAGQPLPGHEAGAAVDGPAGRLRGDGAHRLDRGGF